MPTLADLDAFEILDSRGRPTIEVICRLASGACAHAQVPSGASTGAAEALELRDGDPGRHAGRGCLRAVANVRGEIRSALTGREYPDQATLDSALVQLDGTTHKSRLGANAILGVSIAFARAHAIERGIPLYRHLADQVSESPDRIPRPTINLFSGGKHAGGQVAIQDVLIVPIAANSMAEALAHASAVYCAAAELARKRYHTRPLVADEGGLAPPFPSVEAMLADAVDSIHAAGFRPGRDIALAVDIAASHFHHDQSYQVDGKTLSRDGMISLLREWVARYPIVSLEDGLAEEDWSGWQRLTSQLAPHALVLGDDLLCTHTERIRRAVGEKAANALLLKVNQVGTLSEAAEARSLARSAGWHVTISARSGETEDHWLADLATGWRGDHIKIGSITRSERLAKYNRLLAIERETGWSLAAHSGPP